MTKQFWIVLAAVVLGTGSASAKLSVQQQTYFNLLKGKMISNVNSVSSSGVRSGETTVGVGVSVTIPGMGEMDMDVSSKDTLHLCSDGSYIRSLEDNAMGMKSSSREVGKWTIGKANSAGFALLLTVKGNKKAKSWNLSFDGERTVVNNERWYRMKSSACK
jgi:hypothetical protein